MSRASIELYDVDVASREGCLVGFRNEAVEAQAHTLLSFPFPFLQGAWLKEARDKRETRRIAPAPVAVKNPPRKLVSKDEEEEEEEEDEEEEEKVIVNIENVRPPPLSLPSLL